MKNIKSLMLTLILGLGVILSTVSCSKQSAWDELEHIKVSLYKKQGSVEVFVDYKNNTDEEHILQPHQSLNLLRSELNKLEVVALEDNTTVSIHGQLIQLNKSESTIWYANK